MAWVDPLSIEEYVAFQLATLAFLLHKKGMKESSQTLIRARSELIANLDTTLRAKVEAAQDFHVAEANTAPAK